jgi:PAS domain S-box-containing protein
MRPPLRGAAENAAPATAIINDELFALLVQSVRDYAIFLLDPEGRVITWNEGAQRIKGYKASEIIGRHFSTFYPREVAESGLPAYELKEAARVGRFEDEGWRVRNDGSLFWANVVITAVRDHTGTLRGFAKVTRDLTERRKAEESLRLSEERYRLLVEGVPDYAIYLLDPNGNVLTWNSGAERVKGHKARDILGKHFSAFYPPEAIAAREPELELENARLLGRYESEGWRIRGDGSRFWASIAISPLYDTQGRLYGFSKITRDVTERRNHELAMQVLNQELQARVNQLDAANRALASKSAENEAFVYSVSHDVRGPLVNLQGFSQELERGCGELSALVGEPQMPAGLRDRALQIITGDMAESVRYIQTSVRHLGNIVDSLLRLSRAGRVIYRVEPVDVNALLRRVVDTVKGTVSACDAEITLLPVPPTNADATALEQVFANLLANALQYRERSRPCRIEVGALPGPAANTTTYYVKDNGMGIPEKNLAALFTAFHRLHPDASPGEGIGLAMVKRVIDRLHGEIRVESQAGLGTTFFIDLPNPAGGEDR